VDISADSFFTQRSRRMVLLTAFLFLFNRRLLLILNAVCNQNAKYNITESDGPKAPKAKRSLRSRHGSLRKLRLIPVSVQKTI
jgi:hypothetical protein